MKIDVEKLVGVKRVAGRIKAQCPACAAIGSDLDNKNHLIVFQDGKFGCAVDSSQEHKNIILSLVGTDAVVEAVSHVVYKHPVPEIEEFFDIGLLNHLVKDYDFYKNKGIKESVLKELRSGVAIKGKMAHRYVFPIFNRRGKIHGFSGRSLIGKDPKWKHLAQKSYWLYPAFLVEEDIKREKSVILVESIGDLLSLMSAGVRNVLVLFGVEMSSKLLSYLISLNPDKIYISTNNDAGHKKYNVGAYAADKLVARLKNYFDEEKIEIALPSKKDWGLMNEFEIKEYWENAWATEKV